MDSSIEQPAHNIFVASEINPVSENTPQDVAAESNNKNQDGNENFNNEIPQISKSDHDDSFTEGSSKTSSLPVPLARLAVFLEKRFEALGAWTAREGKDPNQCCGFYKNAWILIVISVIFGIAFSAGAASKEDESRPEKLWIPEDAPSLVDSDWVKNNWPSMMRMNFAITTCIAANGCTNGNILAASKLKLLYKQYHEINQISVPGNMIVSKLDTKHNTPTDRPWSEFENKYYVYDTNSVLDSTVSSLDLTSTDPDQVLTMKCYAPSGTCEKRTIFTVLNITDTDMKNDLDGSLMDSWSDNDILTRINNYNPQFSFPLSSVLSKIEYATPGNPNTNVVKAEAVLTIWNLQSDEYFDPYEGMQQKDPANDQWEHLAMCVLGQGSYRDRDEVFEINTEDDCKSNAIGGNLETRLNFRRSFSDEFGRAILGDLPLIATAPMIMVVYLIIVLGKRDRVHSMIGLSVAAVLVIFLAIFAGLGFSYMIGTKHCTLANNVYFLILGLGVDDCFVITSEYDRAMQLSEKASKGKWSSGKIFGHTVRTSALSITITSLTDAVAFFIGSTSSIPALQYFCTYCGFCVTFVYIFQLTFVVPALILNHKRSVIQNFYDVCCCVCCYKPKDKHEYLEPTGYCNDKIVGCKKTPALPKVLDYFVRKCLLTIPGKIVTILVWLGVLAISIIGCVNLKADFQLEWFFPPDSYVQDFFEWNDKYFATGKTMSIYLQDFPSGGSSQTTIFDCVDDLNDWAINGGGGNIDSNQMRQTWFSKFKVDQSIVTNSYTGADFYTKLKQFDNNEIARTGSPSANSGNFQWVDSSQPLYGLKALKIPGIIIMESKINGGGWERYNTMEDIRKQVKNTCSYGLAFGRDFMFWEETGYMGPEFMRNALLCFLVISVIIFFMIPKLSISIPCILLIIASIIMVIGHIHWWGESICGVVSIYTVVSIGLAVDYVVHLCHMFSLSDAPTATLKTLDAYTRIGPSVLNSLISTFLAIILLSSSESFVFRVFFKVLMLVVIFGSFTALWVCPVVLCIVNGGISDDIRKYELVDIDQYRNSAADNYANFRKSIRRSIKKN